MVWCTCNFEAKKTATPCGAAAKFFSTQKLYKTSYFEDCRSPRIRGLATVLYPLSTQKLYNKSYFEAGRSLRNRSLLDVNEDFEDEPDAERALLDDFC